MKKVFGSGSVWVTLVILVVTGLIVWTAPSFQTCIAKHDPQGFWSGVGTYRECVGHFIHENADPIIAAFTVVLAISTVLLWMATRGLYEAGERQLAHAERQFIATHRPRITVRFVQGPMHVMPEDRLAAVGNA